MGPIDSLWKWSKINQNYANANAFFLDWKISLRYSGYAIGKLTSRAFRKCGSFCCYNFLNPSYGCSKSTESEILAMAAKIRKLQFCVLGSAIESASKHTYWANADSIWKLETQNCSRVIFPNGLTFQLFSLNFDPTLTSRNSGLKN